MPKRKTPVIDLIIPGILNLPAHELNIAELESLTPALHQLLRFSNQVPSRLVDVDEIIIQRLGLKQRALPYAYAIQPAKKGRQLLFKPVHLKADINNAIVYPVDENDDDIILLINDLKSYFKENCEIENLPGKRWIMRLLDCEPVIDVPHYLSAVGNKFTHYLEQSRSNLEWFRLFNEMQMFLYQHEINQQRLSKGQLPVNSLWCWGADPYLGETVTETVWYSDDPDMQSLGELYAGHSDNLNNLAFNEANLNTVIIDLSILKHLKGNSAEDTVQVLNGVEERCAKLLSARQHQIIVHTGGSVNLHYRHLAKLKFWKKPATLRDFIVQSHSSI